MWRKGHLKWCSSRASDSGAVWQQRPPARSRWRRTDDTLTGLDSASQNDLGGGSRVLSWSSRHASELRPTGLTGTSCGLVVQRLETSLAWNDGRRRCSRSHGSARQCHMSLQNWYGTRPRFYPRMFLYRRKPSTAVTTDSCANIEYLSRRCSSWSSITLAL